MLISLQVLLDTNAHRNSSWCLQAIHIQSGQHNRKNIITKTPYSAPQLNAKRKKRTQVELGEKNKIKLNPEGEGDNNGYTKCSIKIIGLHENS